MRPRPILTLTCDNTAGSARDAHHALRAALEGGPALLPLAPGLAGERVAAALRPEQGEQDLDVALIVPTSGSTGTPKGVLLTEAALRASAAATHERLGGPGHWLLALPVHHIAGIQVLTRSLLAGFDPCVLDSATGFRPETFAAAAGPLLAQGRAYTALVPTQLSRLIAEAGSGLAALREFAAVIVGGAATPPALLRAARDAGVAVSTTYGMSETAGGCVYDGLPLTGARVRLGQGDAVELGGPMLARGYRLAPEATAAVFAEGWFRTGDLGRFAADGRLEILGRADDVIITGGEKVPPALVERALTDCPGVREACVVGVPDPEWGQAVAAVVVPAEWTAPPAAEQLREAVRDVAGRACAPRRVLFLPELPLRGPGKVDRRAVAELLAQDD
ncbi:MULTISPECIES: o-succinylbenzoate--CoA ligase [unclassified Crossiella]|uniref:o-succinylbenzoate--CoA ligase n=1 Tax=unclassified Crossiella TaxID=2620835 RepID=UPI001FFFB72B|nr:MULTISPECIES: o-succinylbenzoate--CoA ligase [unclassified Crossiella]MCK2236758.1 o-succinylbenzoate--CoA ligase [Crossiella sp. S99.2]MCK2250426.1 o-succinylbenzoate--CoA ligase [Crossiella sp. S99.1]